MSAVRILMTGGGTAGHIHPAITIADALKRRYPQAEILFVGAQGKMETQLVPQAGYPIKALRVSGFRRKWTPAAIGHNIAAAAHAVTASAASRSILRKFAPDVAVGTGGYVCGPVLRIAAEMGIPVVLHESNALPGVTVRALAHAATVCLCEESARAYLPEDADVVVTGNPLPPENTRVEKADARNKLGLDDRPVVLSFGGSLGAKSINEAMTGVLERGRGKIQFIHGAGKTGFPKMCEDLRAKGIPLHGEGIWVREFIDDMAECMAAADLVVCRCGAMTLTEIQACGKPSVLIPSPYVAENHQFHNAQALVARKAAVCLEENRLTADTLWDEIRALIETPGRLDEMGAHAREGASPDALEKIVRVIASKLGNKS